MSEDTTQDIPPQHYHGDTVRDAFIVTAVLMLIGLPWFMKYLDVPLLFSLAAIVVLAFSAGLSSPRLMWTAGLNTIVSIAGFLVFESRAVTSYTEYGPSSKFFIANQLLALIMAFAIYYSVKTLRWFFLSRN